MNIESIFFSYELDGIRKDFLIEPEEKNCENEDFILTNSYIKKDNKKIFTSTLKVKRELKILKFYIITKHYFEINNKILLNGYQTWSETKEYSTFDKQKDFPLLLKPIINRYKIKYLGDYTIYKYSSQKGVFHCYSWTYIREDDIYNFYGSLNEDSGFTIFEYNTNKNIIKISKDCCNKIVKDSYELINLIFLHGDEDYVFNEYFKDLNIKLKTDRVATGWTSWYNYYTNISENIILENLNAFEKNNIKIDYFQIDDGYQNATGDWLIIKESFPQGMKFIADQIHSKGYKAGIWLAPFICSVNSILFKEHKDFLLKDKKGNPLPAGYSDVWNGDFYILDFYNSDVREYLKKVFNTFLNDWGFDLVKLDFLYAVALYPKEDKTRGEIMKEAIDFLNTLGGDKKILGCGVPLNSVFGKVDYCRIGSDVGLTWENPKLKFINYRERISTICAIKDSIFRRFLNFRGFINDTDVFLLRNENIFLDKNQKFTLFLLNQIFGGLLFTSDNLNNYDEETLFLYKSHIPFRKKDNIKVYYENDLYKIDFSIGDIHYTVYSNLKEDTYKVKIDKILFFNNNFLEKDSIIELAPFESICLVNVNNNDFQILGSTAHIFGGSEIEKFEIINDNIILEFNENILNPTTIFIKIPINFDGYKVNNNFITAEENAGYKIIKVIKN